MARAGFRQKLRYRFDSFMSRGGRSIFINLRLIFVSLLTVIVMRRAATYGLFRDAPSQWGRTFWDNLYITFLQLAPARNTTYTLQPDDALVFLAEDET